MFRRIPFNMKSPQELESYFAFEVAPYPVALFDEDGMMGKTKKSDLYKLFLPTEVEFSKDSDFVVDAGFLMHRVVWNTGENFSSVITKYLNYVQSNFGSHCCIVFDGYPETSKKALSQLDEPVELEPWHLRLWYLMNRWPQRCRKNDSLPTNATKNALLLCSWTSS